MECKKETETKITIVLTEAEANILAGLLQNSQVPPEAEDEDIRLLRHSIFNAIKDL